VSARTHNTLTWLHWGKGGGGGRRKGGNKPSIVFTLNCVACWLSAKNCWRVSGTRAAGILATKMAGRSCVVVCRPGCALGGASAGPVRGHGSVVPGWFRHPNLAPNPSPTIAPAPANPNPCPDPGTKVASHSAHDNASPFCSPSCHTGHRPERNPPIQECTPLWLAGRRAGGRAGKV